MDNIKVSVIVPVFNNSQYIGATLDSIINQDFDSFEIIIIDDGSSDNSLDIACEKLKATNIPNAIVHQENQGVSSARNKGIEISNGDYLVFVDADDIIAPNHLSSLYNGECEFSLTQLVKKEGENTSSPHIYSQENISTKEFIEMELKMQIPFNFVQLMYNADIIKSNSIKFSSDYIYGEDTYFALTALSYGDRISISNEITYYYIQHPTSAIRTSEFRRFDIVDMFEELGKFYEKRGLSDLSKLITTSRIPKAIFGNMNYFFYNSYDFNDVIDKMKEMDLLTKLSKFEGDSKFKLKIKLFLLNPKIYYKVWKKFKNSID
ncbi:glycosyltransferase family A protein [Methanobrevibacter sp.]|uniref:glycosyltransferase family 2 protein n=1 Tax=Methanobrevibacter sp. TaxID=66852 RepID=UPI0026E05D0C|nr:glycosyltransferase family A protein [Methanobrevibacter sp.]MDO5861140.1 glycosyltransferase family A protein [Methanobrevibacter sp.]